MTLPSFLGIGVPRAGTTWLNTLLASHPDVYTPTLRDEINFFDRYYERGIGWYETLFPPPEHAERYRAIGEITPQYCYCQECPERIFNALPESKLILMLRHPVNRAYSQYGFFVQRRNFRGSFEDFTAARPRALEKGFYASHIKRYLRYFDRTQILALVFENAVTDIVKTQKSLADFLNIAVDGFPPSAGIEKVNPSSVPKFQFLYGSVAKTGRQLRRWHLEPIVDFVMRTSIQRFLAKGNPLPPLDDDLKRQLSLSYQDEFNDLEQCLQIDLSSWRDSHLTVAPASARLSPGISH
jgi:hypothetical protein